MADAKTKLACQESFRYGITPNLVVEHFILQENLAYSIIQAAAEYPIKWGTGQTVVCEAGFARKSRQQDPVAPPKGVEKLRAPKCVMLGHN